MDAPANPCNGCGAELFCLKPGSDTPPRFTGGGVSVLQIGPFGVQDVVPQHSHTYEHLTVLVSGAVDVFAEGRFVGSHVAPDGIVIAAGVKHTFVGRADHTVLLCVHRIGADGKIPVLSEHRIEEFGSCR